MTVAAVIVAAGSGLRAGGERPKQYQLIGGRPVLWWTLKAFCGHPRVEIVQAVIAEAHKQLFEEASAGLPVRAVVGGSSRQESCRAGIEALELDGTDHVLVHDAARPFVSSDLIDRVITGLSQQPAVVPGLPIAETLKRAPEGLVAETVDRRNMWVAQTPQGFDYRKILDAYRKAPPGAEFTDDAAVAAFGGLPVMMVMGSEANRKLTTASDIADANLAIRASEYARLGDIRTGQGFDVHAFGPGDYVTLAGVRIPHTRSLAGHSDADAPLHALTDALLGAIGENDIGTHFPPSDSKWKNAASTIFLEKAVELIKARGGRVAHVDLTILCEAPRISPHVTEMKSILGRLLGIEADRIGIKATTMEKLGFIGRNEGIAALATATVRLPG
jgi:2-C-methyl-D-erythritol 4-phosphate cytidylyltransferase / 2-C-methyl-D-erythritol 2,4-cyclodiphosphate synthase